MPGLLNCLQEIQTDTAINHGHYQVYNKNGLMADLPADHMLPTRNRRNNVSKIYLATSWRNEYYYHVLHLLRDKGHEVYDFREKGFKFDQLADKPWDLPPREQAELLKHPIAVEAFKKDYEGVVTSDVLIMLYPCGNDAHVELGYAAAYGLYTIVYIREGYNVGLMDKVANIFVFSDEELLEAL